MPVANYLNLKQFLDSFLMSVKSPFRYFILLIIVEFGLHPTTINLVSAYAIIIIYEVNEPYKSPE